MTARSSLVILVSVVLAAGSVLSETSQHTLVSDPSVNPPDGNLDTNIVRERAYGDINKDGFEDMIVSDASGPSQNGYPLFIYFGDSSGMYWLYDTTFSFPWRLKFERDALGIRMWSTWHISAGETIIAYDFLTDTGLVSGGKMTIYPHDGCGEIDLAIMAAIYDNSDVELTEERYRIVNGKAVIWKD